MANLIDYWRVQKSRFFFMPSEFFGLDVSSLCSSVVSYHVALHREPGKTALIVSHRSQEILWQHYLGVANREDAEQYFAILPK